MPNQKPFDAYQRIFAMSMLSNAAMGKLMEAENLPKLIFSRLSGSITAGGDTDDARYPNRNPVSQEVQDVLGEATLEWGPAVYATYPLGATEEEIEFGLKSAQNVIFVARYASLPATPQGPSGPVYIVAVAATNSTSLPDLVFEDADIVKAADWGSYVRNDGVLDKTEAITGFTDLKKVKKYEPAAISWATAAGVSDCLQKLTAPDWVTSHPSTTLVEYLNGVEDKAEASIVFCGHSLAGALAPTLALFLKQRADSPIAGFKTVYLYPTAGASPGNAAFIKEVSDAFPPDTWQESKAAAQPYQFVNARLWNRFDVVPHAWALDSRQDFDGNHSPIMQQIMSLYGQLEPMGAERAGNYVFNAMLMSKLAPLAYDVLPGVRLPGAQPSPPPGDFLAFAAEMLSAHIGAYSHGLILPDGVPGKANAEDPV